jgi:hypothetical protein
MRFSAMIDKIVRKLTTDVSVWFQVSVESVNISILDSILGTKLQIRNKTSRIRDTGRTETNPKTPHNKVCSI